MKNRIGMTLSLCLLAAFKAADAYRVIRVSVHPDGVRLILASPVNSWNLASCAQDLNTVWLPLDNDQAALARAQSAAMIAKLNGLEAYGWAGGACKNFGGKNISVWNDIQIE